MTIRLPFTKASGAGNDFVLLNAMKGPLPVDYAVLARAVCDRHFGVGGDGLLVLEPAPRADFLMRYYNADGSYGGMCGNGGRCAARYAFLERIAGSHMRFEALDYVYEADVAASGIVRLSMKDPSGFRPGISLFTGKGGAEEGTFIDTGAPHVVIFSGNIDALDVETLGRAIRSDSAFAPAGTNVNFATPPDGSRVRIRTYERGVEAETLACGTGSVASALVSAARFGLRSPVSVRVRSGEELLVHFTGTASAWHDITLEGSAHILFQGTLLYDPASSTLRESP